jgi:putative phosphoribosyl transferase
MQPILIEEARWREREGVFADRAAAGELLAAKLSAWQGVDGLVLAIPAGGVPVAAPIARNLKLPLELLIVRKVQIPWNTEAGFGALAPDGQVILNEPLVRALDLTPAQIQAQIKATQQNLREREAVFRGNRPYPEMTGKTLIVVDDGLASGYTMLAALQFLLRQHPQQLIVAVPTGLLDTINTIMAKTGATVVCLNVRTRRPFAVAAAYQRWYDLSEAEVLALLRERDLGQKEAADA